MATLEDDSSAIPPPPPTTPRFVTKSSWAADEQQAPSSPRNPRYSTVELGTLRTRASSWAAASKRNLSTDLQGGGGGGDGSWARGLFASGKDLVRGLVAPPPRREDQPVSQPAIWRLGFFLVLCTMSYVFVFRAFVLPDDRYSDVADALLWSYICRALWPFSVAVMHYIVMSDPTSKYCGLEIASVVLVAFQACVNASYPQGVENLQDKLGELKDKYDSTLAGKADEYEWPDLAALWLPIERNTLDNRPFRIALQIVYYIIFGALLLKFRNLASQLGKESLQQLIWTTNPKLFVSCLLGLAFFSAPMISCLANHHYRAKKSEDEYDSIPDHSDTHDPTQFFESLACEDISDSSFAMKTALTNSQFMALFVAPTVLKNYS